MDQLIKISKKVAEESGASIRAISATYVKNALASFGGIPAAAVDGVSLQDVWLQVMGPVPLPLTYSSTHIFSERKPIAVDLSAGFKSGILRTINEYWDPQQPAAGIAQNSAGSGKDHLYLILVADIGFATAAYERALVRRNYVVREYPKEDRVVFSTQLKNLKYHD